MTQLILLVEDNEDDVFFMQRALKAAGLENRVQVAEDGQRALDYLAGAGAFSNREEYPLPRLIFLDLKLPFVSGLEVLQWMRAQAQLCTLPVIVLTSSMEHRDVDLAYRRGANSYLVKPASTDKLLEMVKAVRDFWINYNHFPPGPAPD
jgi:CheY-like chemotaxis protein